MLTKNVSRIKTQPTYVRYHVMAARWFDIREGPSLSLCLLSPPRRDRIQARRALPRSSNPSIGASLLAAFADKVRLGIFRLGGRRRGIGARRDYAKQNGGRLLAAAAAPCVEFLRVSGTTAPRPEAARVSDFLAP